MKAPSRGTRQEQGRQGILEAAARLLAADGYHGMAMRDLARSTGMSLANLYNYFRSKDDLVFALQTRAFESLIATAEAAVGEHAAADARLYAFVLNHVRYVTAHPEVMRVLVREARELPPSRRQAVRDLKERYFRLLRDVVRAVAKGASESDVDRSTYHIFGMLNWIYGWYRADRHGTPQEVARSIHQLTLCGLAAPTPSTAMLADLERRVEHVKVTSPIAGAR